MSCGAGNRAVGEIYVLTKVVDKLEKEVKRLKHQVEWLYEHKESIHPEN
jgi:hypothetical protein